MMNVTELAQLIIGLAVCLITTFLLPYLKAKLGAETFDEMTRWISVLVDAAEQLFGDDGKKKKTYVLMRLRELGYDVSDAGLDDAIEAAVLNLHAALYGD